MSDETRLRSACEWINRNVNALHPGAPEYLKEIAPSDVAGNHVEGETLMLVINRGILGSPKYYVPLAHLEIVKKIEPESETPKVSPRRRAKIEVGE